MIKNTFFLTLLLFASTQLVAQPIIELQTYASGFTRPVDISHANDARLFVTEQRGRIMIIDGDGQVLGTPFLDIQSRVGDSGNEQGLLGLAFHPNYAENGYFFVNYTNNSGNTHISRFKVSAENPNVANPDGELVLLTVNQPFGNHNAGDLAFGPDGYLYIPLGDGGSAGDPGNRSQNRTNLLGKMLRIDVDNGNPYAIPADNPFANDDFTLDEIWAIGLRNPWRFSFDRLTGDMWIGDVGQNAWEEVDLQPANSTGGENYGWRCYEGNHPENTSGCGDFSEYTPPIYEYNHNLGCSITGGFVYRGQDFPAIDGYYFYTDICSGRIWTLRPDGAGGWINEQMLRVSNGSFSTFGEDQNGELYIAGLNSGNISRIVELCGNFAIETAATTPCPGEANGAIDLSITDPVEPFTISWSTGATTEDLSEIPAGEYIVSVLAENGCERTDTITLSEIAVDVFITADPEDSLSLSVPEAFVTYQWYLDGEPIANATSNNYTATLSGEYSVEITDEQGCTYTSDTVMLVVTATAEELGLTYFRADPNPFGNFVNLELMSTEDLRLSIRLLDAQGKLLFASQEKVFGAFRKEIPTADLPAGLYILSLEQNGKVVSKQLIKQ